MSSLKTLNEFGFMAKVETTYGTRAVCAGANDGVLLLDIPEPDESYLNDGSRGTTVLSGPRPRVNMSGRQMTMKLLLELLGAGAAYSASIKPNADPLLRACGLQPTGSFGVGTESWKYAPESSTFESTSAEAYIKGQLHNLYGGYGNFQVSVDGPAVPTAEVDLNGIADIPTDAAIPAISSYPPASRLPPKAEGVTFTLGTFTAGIVRGFTFNMNREYTQTRANINSGSGNAHAGFTPGKRAATLEVTFESTALATTPPYHTATTLNPYQLKELGTLVVCSLAIGTVQYNRWKIFSGSPVSAAQASVIEVKEQKEGPTSLWTVTIEFHPSSYNVNDDFTISFD